MLDFLRYALARLRAIASRREMDGDFQHEWESHLEIGGQSRQIHWLILKRGLAQVGAGLALGVAGALGVSQVLASVVVEIAPTDPVTYAATVVVLTVVSIAACLVPARRATRIDPITALRAE